jgi:hypothetical protein
MRKDINSALGNLDDYKVWSVVWGPGLTDDRSNVMYVAGNIVTNQLAVVIRGTDPYFWLDWVEDFASLLPLVPFPFLLEPHEPGIEVAIGTLLGLEVLSELTGVGQIENSEPVTLLTFLQEQLNEPDIFVTGHSLGACLASVTAAWLATMFLSAARFKVYTFAAPSAGNGAFAGYYNTLDAIPSAWASLPTLGTYYQPAPLCPEYIKEIIAEAEKDIGNEYVQVGTAAQGSAIALQGSVIPWWSWWDLDPTGTVPFAHQILEQHHPATYMSLLTGGTPMTAPAAKLTAMGARLKARQAAPTG